MSMKDLGNPSHLKKCMERMVHQKTGFASDDTERGLREPMQTDMWRMRGWSRAQQAKGGGHHSWGKTLMYVLHLSTDGESSPVCLGKGHELQMEVMSLSILETIEE